MSSINRDVVFWNPVSITLVHTREGGLPGCCPPSPKRNLQNTDFVDTTISNALRDLRFGLNQPLKSADDGYIGIYIRGVPGGMCQTSGGCSLC